MITHGVDLAEEENKPSASPDIEAVAAAGEMLMADDYGYDAHATLPAQPRGGTTFSKPRKAASQVSKFSNKLKMFEQMREREANPAGPHSQISRNSQHESHMTYRSSLYSQLTKKSKGASFVEKQGAFAFKTEPSNRSTKPDSKAEVASGRSATTHESFRSKKAIEDF